MRESDHDVYSIDYTKLPYNSRVIVYGAGLIGITYIKSIMNTERLSIEAIADRNRFGEECEGFIIIEPSEIVTYRFDYVLIALETLSNARDAMSYFVSVGIPSDKLVWFGSDKTTGMRGKWEYNKFLERNWKTSKKRIFIFMIPEHGNVGDYAIAYAELAFFRDYFWDYDVLTVTTNEWINAKAAIIGYIQPDDIIFFNGGGYLGDLWEGDRENYRSVIELFPGHKIIFFPNTLTFKDGTQENEVCKEEVIWLGKHNNICVMFRDYRSFKVFNQYGGKAFFFPDMVFYAGVCKRLFSSREESHKRNEKSVLLCLRNDREKAADSDELIRKMQAQDEYQYESFSVNAERYLPFSDGYDYIKKICKKMKQFDCVITDRLHGMILSVISDVPCIALDNRTKKVKGVIEWLPDKRMVSYCDDIDGIEIKELIHQTIQNKKEAGNFVFSAEEFEKMAELINEMIRQVKR